MNDSAFRRELMERDARICELEAQNERLEKTINKAGQLAMQKASHEFIRQILAEAIKQEGEE